ncbi:MAG: undecaprenyl/decaprenyl-phosphate alpha-N-acetylglucosaminyl 1-phosphate transferase [Candidatus Brocadiaceae bacterium]|nr:undecaprenyl/decaprenyl-phosphate alpha-N-acetylglucosaminyl 1-phosphate transferase [Candidatus Brocadiaceae bacterium]
MIYAVTFALAFGLGLVGTLGARAAAPRLGIVDRPDGFRKLHAAPIPLLGGAAIFAAFFLALLAARHLGRATLWTPVFRGDGLLTLLGGAALVVLVGIWDDIRDLRPAVRVLFMTVAAALMYARGYSIASISNPFGPAIELGAFALPLTIFWFLGCMNALNLIDGLDGLAGGVALFTTATICLLALMLGNTQSALLALALAGAVAGFLPFNFPPASIYLGSSGSLLLGFLIACFGVSGSHKGATAVALLIPVIALGLPVMDTSLAILRRWARALPVSCSDRQHIHHKLLDMGLSHRTALLVMYGGCIVLGLFALAIAVSTHAQTGALLVALAACVVLAVRIIGRHEVALVKTRIVDAVHTRRERRRCLTASHVAAGRIARTADVDDLWQLVVDTARALQLDAAEMALRLNGRRVHRSWTFGDDADFEEAAWDAAESAHHGPGALWSAVYPLTVDGRAVGSLHARKSTNGRALGPSVPHALDMLIAALRARVAELHAAGPAGPSAGHAAPPGGPHAGGDAAPEPPVLQPVGDAVDS